MLQFLPIIASFIRESQIGQKKVDGVSQTIGEALTNKTNLISMPFLGIGISLLEKNPDSEVAIGIIFGSMVLMAIRDTLDRLIKLQQAKNKEE